MAGAAASMHWPPGLGSFLELLLLGSSHFLSFREELTLTRKIITSVRRVWRCRRCCPGGVQEGPGLADTLCWLAGAGCAALWCVVVQGRVFALTAGPLFLL